MTCARALGLLLLLLPAAARAGDAPADIKLRLPELHERKLDNGARLVALRAGEVPLVHYLAVVDAGSCRDPEGKEGVASLTADLIQEGTTTHPGEQFGAALDDLGGSLAASAGRDALSVSASFLAKDQALGAQLFLETLLEPAFAKEDVEKARLRAGANLKVASEETADIVTDFLYWKLFEGSRYAHPPEGGESTVAALGQADVVAFHRKHFVAGGLLVIAAGDLDPESTLDLLAKRIGALPRTAPLLPPTSEESKDLPALRILLVDDPGVAQAQVRLGWRSVPPRDPDALVLETLSGMIGGGFSSRLVERLRVDLGLTYDVANEVRPMRSSGIFMVTGSTGTASLARMVREMLGVVGDLSSAPVDGEELARAKRSMLAQLVLAVETPAGLAEALSDAIYHGLKGTRPQEMVAELAGLGPERCKEVIERRVTGRPKVLVVLGDAQQLGSALNELGPVEIVEVARELR